MTVLQGRARARRPGEDPRARGLLRPAGHLGPPPGLARSPSPSRATSTRPGSSRAAASSSCASTTPAGTRSASSSPPTSCSAGELVDAIAVSKGKGFAGGHEAAQLQGPGRGPRQPQEAPLAGLDRRLRHPGPGLQGHPDGRSHGRPAGHHAQPRGRPGRPRARADPGARERSPGPAAAWSSCATRSRAPTAGAHHDAPTTIDRRPPGSVAGSGPSPSTAPSTAGASTAPCSARSTLDPQIFGIEPNVAVLHQVVTAQLAAARAGTQSTKTRAEVRGGGAKPFRQKGTGRARQGSTRSPQWAGGGVALGPKPRSYAPAHPEEDDPPGPALGPVGPGRREGKVVVVDDWSFEVPEDQGRRGRPRRARARRPGARRPRRRRRLSPTAPSATCPTSRPSWPASSTPTTSCATTGSSSPTTRCRARRHRPRASRSPSPARPGGRRGRSRRGRGRRRRRRRRRAADATPPTPRRRRGRSRGRRRRPAPTRKGATR